MQLTTFGVWASQLNLVPADGARKAVQKMEELGYGTVWVGEADGREALTHAGILLSATERCRIATGIANIWARDAQAMINAGRTLAEAHANRFVLGIGASHVPLVQRRGHQYGKPYTAMVTYLDAMERAAYTSPPPSEEVPVMLAALGPKMLQLARERADGAHTYFVPVAHTRQAREALGPDAVLAPEQAMVPAADRDHARQLAGRHVARYLELPNYRRNLERLGWDASDLDHGGSDALFDALIAWGDMEKLAGRAHEHLDAGADHVAVHLFTDSPTRLPLAELADLAGALR